VRDSHGYKIISGHFQFHAAVLARQLNPKAGELIPARVLETENQTTAERPTWDTKTQSRLNTTAPPKMDGAHFYPHAIVNLPSRGTAALDVIAYKQSIVQSVDQHLSKLGVCQ